MVLKEKAKRKREKHHKKAKRPNLLICAILLASLKSCMRSVCTCNKQEKKTHKQAKEQRKEASKQALKQRKGNMLTKKQVERKHVREQTSKHVYKQASKEKECPQGKNVCLDIVSIDPLHWIMDDLHANKHGSKKGTRDV